MRDERFNCVWPVIQIDRMKRSKSKPEPKPIGPRFTPARLVLTGIVILLAAALVSTFYSSRMLMASMRRLGESERLSSLSDQAATISIESEFARQDELFLMLSRYAIPRREWSYLLLEFEVSLMEFLENQRYRDLLPQQVARAHFNHARIMFLRGENRGAREALNQSIAASASAGNRFLAGKAKNTLGCVEATLGDFKSSFELFRDAYGDLNGQKAYEKELAISLRNLGLVQRALGRDGTESVREAIRILERDALGGTLGAQREMIQDFRMTLCEMYWAKGNLELAADLCMQTLEDLKTSLSQIDDSGIGKTLISRNRYVKAIRYGERNLTAITKAIDQSTNLSSSEMPNPNQVSWQWQRLCDLSTDLVSDDMMVSGTSVAEFDHQGGLVMAWGMYGWSHDVIVEIAKNVHDRTQVVLFADNDDSLEEVQSALKQVGVPLDAIQFRVEDCENPWFRDPGPIVSRSPSGTPIWFDSRLTRPGIYGRTVLDTLPRLLQRNWNARIADLPIHVEGGMILSNGNGIVVASKEIIALNLQYGFSEETIVRELRRATGAKQLILVDPLIGEPTKHLDLFMTFVNPTTVVLAESVDRNDSNASILDNAARKLEQVNFDGEPLDVVRLPMPNLGEDRFPTYTNVVFANGVLLVPSYDGVEKNLEEKVRSTYQDLLPTWQVRFIDCSRLYARGGALHCLVSNLGDAEFLPAASPKPISKATASLEKTEGQGSVVLPLAR